MSGLLVKETQGETLTGVIDGVNTRYVTSFPFESDQVNVYVNGRLKIRDWCDGFDTEGDTVVILREPLLDGDSLEIEYRSNVKTGGGAEGGVPDVVDACLVQPDTESHELVPVPACSMKLETRTDTDLLDTETLARNLRPVIIREGDC